jgi:O-antigen/teichoic acid export membrane protein
MIIPGRDSVRRNLFFVLLGQVVTWGITALTLLLVPRYLGAGDLGVYSVAATIWALASAICGLGMSALVVRDVARRLDSSGTLVSTAFWVSQFAGLTGAAAAVLCAWAAGYSWTVVWVVATLVATLPLSLAGNTISSTLAGLEIMRWNVVFDVVLKASMLVGTFLAIYFDLGLFGVTGASSISAVLVFAVQLLVLKRLTSISVFEGISFQEAKRLILKSPPFLLVSLSWLLYTSSDIFLLSYLGTVADVGIFAAPMRLFGTALIVPTALMTVMFPRMSATFASGDASFNKLVSKLLCFSTSGSALAACGSLALSDDHFLRIYGDSFSGKLGPVVVVMSLTLIPTTVSIVASRVAFAADRQRHLAVIGLVFFVLKIFVTTALIVGMQSTADNAALGASIGLLVTESAMAATMIRFLPAECVSQVAPYFRRFFAAFGGTAVVGFVLYSSSPFIAGVLAGLAFVVLAGVFRLHTLTQVGELWRPGNRVRVPARSGS